MKHYNKGYYFRGKRANFYYCIDSGEVYSYNRYRDGSEGEVKTEIAKGQYSFDEFIEMCRIYN